MSTAKRLLRVGSTLAGARITSLGWRLAEGTGDGKAWAGVGSGVTQQPWPLTTVSIELCSSDQSYGMERTTQGQGTAFQMDEGE